MDGDEIDLNIREEADIERVRQRDPEDEASDDGVAMPQLWVKLVEATSTSHDGIAIATAILRCAQSMTIWTRSLRRKKMMMRQRTVVNTKKTAKYTPQTARCFILRIETTFVRWCFRSCLTSTRSQR